MCNTLFLKLNSPIQKYIFMGLSYSFHLACEKCGTQYDASEPINLCKKCGSVLEVIYDNLDELDVKSLFRFAMSHTLQSIWKYKALLPHPTKNKNIISLGEGAGNLIHLKNISEQKGLQIYARYYGINPTGTHKDVGMSVAVSMAKEIGIKSAITFSTGNAGTSLAAYCSAAGIKTTIIARDTISKEKLPNILALGAKVISIHNLIDPWALLEDLSKLLPVYYFTNFINPFRAEGHKTLAYDIFTELGNLQLSIYEPLGTGGGIWGSWKGFKELNHLGLVDTIPKINAVQPEAVKHAVVAYESGNKTAMPYGDGNKTKIQSLADSMPLFGDERPLKAVYDSRGKAIAVTDDEAKKALLLLGKDGLFVEPASACSLAGLLKDIDEGIYDKGDNIILSLTGTGLKQPDFSLDLINQNIVTLRNADAKSIAKHIEGDNDE